MTDLIEDFAGVISAAALVGALAMMVLAIYALPQCMIGSLVGPAIGGVIKLYGC